MLGGDANDVLPGVLGDLPRGTMAVVVTTWAFAYFSIADRQRFVELLQVESRSRPITWLSAEGAGTVEAFVGESLLPYDQTMANILGAVTFDGGISHEQLLGFVHQHGSWLDWRVPVESGPAGSRSEVKRDRHR